MRRKLVIAILLLILVSIIVYSMVKGPHEFDASECFDCHGRGPSGNILEDQLTAPVTVLCKNCHDDIFSEGYLHPIDVATGNMDIPRDLPLSKEGKLTCNTCHDIHSPYSTPYGAPSHFLRRLDPGKKFCEACHEDVVPSSAGHKAALGEAHFRSEYVVTDPSQEIDAMSKNCISCHDGSYSSSSTIHVGSWSHKNEFLKYDEGSHPIGVDYEKARMQPRRKTDLKPIDPRMRLFDGRIGCGTCHDPYSTGEKKLVMSNKGSRLCFMCHLLDRG